MTESSFQESENVPSLSPSSHKISKASCPTKKPIRRSWWTPEEDKVLLSHITKLGENWALISSKMPNRTGKQIRDRYLNHLRPNINRDQWTSEEDSAILEMRKKFGHKWKKISTYLPGRTENQVKTRYYKFLKSKEIGQTFAKDQPIKQETSPQVSLLRPNLVSSSTLNWNSCNLNNYLGTGPQFAIQNKIDALKLYINMAQLELLKLTAQNRNF